MGKEVTCWFTSHILDVIKDKGLDLKTCLKGIPYSPEHLHNKHERIEWHVYCRLMKNLRSLFTDEDFEELGRSWAKNPTYLPFASAQRLFFNLSKSLPWVRDHLKKAGRQFVSCIEFEIEDFDPNGFKVILKVKDGYESCREYFLITKGAMAITPTFRGYEQAHVDMEWIDNGAIYKVTKGKKAWGNVWLQKKISWLLAAKTTVRELNDANEALFLQYQELEKARFVQEQQAIQLQTAYKISQVIHQGLNLDLTLKAIVRAFIEIAHFSAAEVRITRDSEGHTLKRKIFQGKIPKDQEPLTEPLMIADCETGLLKAWRSPHQNAAEIQELLKRVIPTITMAVHNALIYHAVLDYRNNLERKVQERTTELIKARDNLAKTVELLREAQSTRDRFFANISHEFRTPLTLILGPVNSMLARRKEKIKHHELSMIQRNAQRLQRLINQLLDLSKLEAGGMRLQARPENIVALLNRIAQSFESQAKLKGIAWHFHSEPDEITAYVDKEKIENIFFNLFSNAVKFTPKGGSVNVECRILNAELGSDSGVPKSKIGNQKSEIMVTVSDTGIGIPPDRLDKIFDRFYQVDDSYTRENEGSGIGLALTRELVVLHHGKIEARSEWHKGTTFTIYLPLGREHLKPEEIISELAAETSEIDATATVAEIFVTDEATPASKESSRRKALPIVLVVEDNRDMRDYMLTCFASDYRVIEAVDGEDGFMKAVAKIPDLIISDVMMPRMDGFELCARLKTDERTSHIPVILLTARAAAEDKIGGLETGADDYIIKPFDIKELCVRAKNLITQRRKLRERFSREVVFRPQDIAITPPDEKFMQRAMEIIQNHIADADFNVEYFCKMVGMSRMQLHRKLRALTDKSSGEFVRALRLKRAAELLSQHFGNITQVAYEVGFNNPSYFAECFRRQFGELPSEYARR